MKLSNRLKRKLDWVNTDTLFVDLDDSWDFTKAVENAFQTLIDLKVSEINDIANFLGSERRPRKRSEATENLMQALREKRNVEL